MRQSTSGVGRNHIALMAWVVLAIVAAGVLLRVLRLDWQPLWWDEGYSLYFASEPLGRMVWLTARDIHPPLYYAVLNMWLGLTGGRPTPDGARLLSAFLGALALPLQFVLARAMFPGRRGLAIAALLLLTFSPIHLYYSQEVRMYGLALTLTLGASLVLWRWTQSAASGAQTASPASIRGRVRSAWPALSYLLAGLAALYTLYYSALLLVAHALWAGVRLRKNLRALGGLLVVYALMLLLYLPWLLYAVPQLVGYVGGKVQSDQDSPLGPLAYIDRHLAAFTAGHVQLAWLSEEWLALAAPTIAICAIILGLVLRQTLTRQTGARSGRQKARGGGETPAAAGGAPAALWTWLLAPVLFGWLINLWLPFFPEGGERLLLFVLPYLLLLLALGVERTWHVAHLGKLAAAALAVSAALGITAFYTTPRYLADDYRALLRQVQQQGAPGDTLLAIFPWQVGYWRAYTAAGDEANGGPQPLLLSDTAAEWSPLVAATIDQALSKGVLWFPEPLTFGASLPHEIEDHLAQAAVNLENRWYDATRLTAWGRLAAPAAAPTAADFGLLRLRAAGIAPAAAASANQPLAATLAWEGSGRSSADAGGEELNVSLRLQDESGHVWASREYARSLPEAGAAITETVGLIVPYGLPPGGYQVAVSVQSAAGEPLTIAGSDEAAAIIGAMEITQPQQWPGSLNLPIQRPLSRPAASDGLRLLGYSGPGRDAALLAGTELAVTLFLANDAGEPPERQIYLSLLDGAGAGVAGYEGWPLPAYPTNAWPEGALVQVPVGFYLSGSLASGDYRLVAGFLDPATGAKTPPAELAAIAVEQRAASFTRPAPHYPLAEPPQVGTHAHLLGYDLETGGDGQTTVTLYWEVLQPLLPPHHIFVHLDDAGGTTRAQQDGPPATTAGAAPTGSWQPGEFLTTVHVLPAELHAGEVLRVGLYDPKTQVRLPVTVNGQSAGDSVLLPVSKGE